MSVPVGRRAALRLAGLAFAGVAGSALAVNDKFDLKELKEDVEAINYDDEVTEVGPDAAAGQKLRTKKKEKEPEFRAEEKEQLKEEEQNYDAMLAKEAAEAEVIKAKFSKK